MRVIRSEADIAEGLSWLLRSDRRLGRIAAVAGPVPLRRSDGGLRGLARIVIGQQVSVASAEAIWRRFETAFPDPSPGAILDAEAETFRTVGLSRPKIATLRAVAEACRAGLDIDRLAAIPGGEAHRLLTGIRGIGPWTADIYLLFCLGHADIFPAGDLALRNAVAEALDLKAPLAAREVATMAERWSPWRGVAARLFWTYYRATRQRAAQPV
ncbi:MAG: DNA-3-methyladenine glycosylase 2 family protein [Bauldia sp.]|uniref:DNA-3-methyladenine glycosylase family protein n=1 Tax=Bauldia sp. TaxID=2575872 RepID=UPI001DE4B307|nr:DNA-3-methyladenine glycosylase 2 family protein [Bauldia sp.]MCB1498024.1 DNA-3-methyladenine glycosylase 2 family protein [Bauldia sp.]